MTVSRPADIDGYVIHRKIATGGMGTVYEVTDSRRRLPRVPANSRLALKTPKRDANRQVLARFNNEIVFGRQVRSPYVPRVLDDGRAADGTPYLVMRFLDGQTLSTYLNRRDADRAPLSIEEILWICLRTGRH